MSPESLLVQGPEYGYNFILDPTFEFIWPLATAFASLVMILLHVTYIEYTDVRTRAGPRKIDAPRQDIRFFDWTRTVCSLVLLALSVTTVKERVATDARVLIFSYISILFLISVFSLRWKGITTGHAEVVLLMTFAIYAYRDLWPLATYSDGPKDLETEGHFFLWSKISLLALSAIIIPLFMPRQYTPEDPADAINPIQTASVISVLVYTYLDPLVFEAYRVAHLAHDRVPPLLAADHTKRLTSKYFPHLDQSRHLFFGLIWIFFWDYAFISATIVFQTFANFASPLAVNRILSSLERHGAGDHVRIWVWVACLFFGQLAVSISFQWYHYLATSALVRAQSILTQLVFEHSLRLRVRAETTGAEHGTLKTLEENAQDNLAGKINTLVTVDLDNIIGAKDCIMLFVQVPLELTLASIFLYTVLGWSAILGCATILILLPVPGFIAVHMQKIMATKMQKTDARVQAVTEAVGVMRMIKMFGWEAKTSETIKEKREEELAWLWKSKLLSLANDMINFTIPIVTMMVTFSIYTLVMKQSLTPSKVFSSMPVFTMIRNLLHHTSWLISLMVKGRVSLDRFNTFLHNTELIDSFEDGSSERIPENFTDTEENEIGFKDVMFVWSKKDTVDKTSPQRTFKLRIDGCMRFKPGGINLLVGPTGCGKTSVLMALLGEMCALPLTIESWVKLPRQRGVAYAAQESWVQNETIRDNILFGSPYDEARYQKVIRQCGLERDLKLFTAGDATEVGEKGLTLSGGQKARITLARAVYSSATILLLDDILAALDVHTSKWIVDECLTGDLVHGRTVILITHNIPLVAPIADLIVSIGNDGTIKEIGSDMAAVLADPTLAQEVAKEESQYETSLADDAAGLEQPVIADISPDGKLVLDEEIVQGRIGWSAIALFLRALGGKYPFFNFTIWILGFLILHGGNLLALWFLGYWGSQYETREPSDVPVTLYLSIYSAILFLSIVCYNIGTTVWYRMTIMSSRTINSLLVESLLSAPLRWLDKTPVSRIISRCTQDIGAIDGSLTLPFSAVLDLSLCIVIRLIGPVILTPFLLIPGTIVIVAGIYLGNIYLKAQMSVKREMSNARSPVLAHLDATTAGLVSIRAYGVQHNAKSESMKRIDHFAKLSRTSWNLNCWVSVRIDLLGTLFTTTLASYLLYDRSLSAANIGFSLNIALEFTVMILWLVRWYNEFEVQANSLERIQGYLEIEHEPESTLSGKAPASWPSSGHLRVENLSARYSLDGPKVLRGLSFEIKGGERVGIVGRTGSGKSSLTLSLLRCILTEGTIYYDDYPIDKINLDDLRSSITIIPQMPELLSGTLRRNLDPFDEHDDLTLNSSLRASGFFSLHGEGEDASNHLNLDSEISSGGKNFSVGQRQIIALARAIVRNSKLLILDEATSAIDHETDTIIQASLRTALGADVTVLTVAHRLQTIMDADRVMVLDNGRIVEFDAPKILLSNSGSQFKALVDESGHRDALYAIANSR